MRHSIAERKSIEILDNDAPRGIDYFPVVTPDKKVYALLIGS
jgi:hypothetical protein